MVRHGYERLSESSDSASAEKSETPEIRQARWLDRLREVITRNYKYWICIIVLAIFGFIALVVGWLRSEERHLRILSRELSCTDSHAGLPFYYFMDQSNYFTGEEFQQRFSIPESNATSTNGTKIAHVQLCSRAYKHNWQLLALLDNHREYAKQHGLRYMLDTGGGREHGVWRNVEALLEIVPDELQKRPEDRLEWIFYTDIDTLFVDPLVSLQDFLPPKDENPFIMLSKDSNGMNFGVFLLRVDVRSVKFLYDILAYPRHQHKLTWAEQSVAMVLVEEQQLEAKGDLIYLQPPVWNDYSGEAFYTQRLPIFLLHFPSWPIKKTRLLPLLDKLRAGQLSLSADALQDCKTRVLEILADFWKQRTLIVRL